MIWNLSDQENMYGRKRCYLLDVFKGKSFIKNNEGDRESYPKTGILGPVSLIVLLSEDFLPRRIRWIQTD